jgi:hypothetical protein
VGRAGSVRALDGRLRPQGAGPQGERAGPRAGVGPGGGGGKRGRPVGLGCGVGFSLFFPISLFPLLSILNLALAFKFKINMLCEFKWRHNNSKHHTKLGALACDATTIIPLGF